MTRPSTDQRRVEILDAVVRVIIDIGYTEMTVAQVAEHAGVSTALVHYHFSSKAELIDAALRAASIDDKQFRDAIVSGGGTATARIDAVLCDSVPVDTTDGSWLLWIETWGETRRSSDIRSVMVDLHAHETTSLRSLLEEGHAAQEFDCPNPSAAVSRLTALRDGLAIYATLFVETSGPDATAGTMRDQLREAIRFELGLERDRYSALLGTTTRTGSAS